MARKGAGPKSAGRNSAGPKGAGVRLIELFLDMQSAERGAAANTLEAYRRDLADFATTLEAGSGAVATATSDDLRAYLADLAARGLAPASQARRLSAVRQLYRFLYAEGH